MEPIPQGHGRSLRLASVLLALLALLALVAFASRTGFGHTRETAPTPAYVNWATSVFLVLFFAMTPFAIYVYVLQARERLERQGHRSFQMRVIRGLGFIFVLAGVYLAAVSLRSRIHLSHGIDQLFFGNRRASGAGKHGGAAAHYSPTFQWPVLWVSAGLLLVAAAAWLWWRRTHPAATLVEAGAPTLEQEVAGSIEDAIGDLEAESDPRRAVIAAYARMEGVLARSGLRREASETPTEYLRRILLGLTSQADAVRQLTGLFEQAKFSAHTIDAPMKRDAIEALRVIRADLLGATA